MGLLPELPRKDEKDAPVRRFLGTVALIWAVIAFGLAMTGGLPRDLPAWSLEHAVVFRFVVWIVLFVVGAFLVNVVALIFHGWLFTGFTAGPVAGQAEKVAKEEENAALQDAVDAFEKVAVGADELIEELHDRIVAVEGSCGIDPPETPPAKLAALLEAAADGDAGGADEAGSAGIGGAAA